MRDRAGPLHAMMEAVVGFSSHHHHQAVQMLYLELLVRYNRFFPLNPQHLGPAFSAFLDERGVYSSRRDVRAKACDLLRRFIKHTLKAAFKFYDTTSTITTIITARRRTIKRT